MEDIPVSNIREKWHIGRVLALKYLKKVFSLGHWLLLFRAMLVKHLDDLLVVLEGLCGEFTTEGTGRRHQHKSFT
jgi:hypothetical protein